MTDLAVQAEPTTHPVDSSLKQPLPLEAPVCVPGAERPWERWWYGLLAMLVVAGFAFTHSAYWVPAHPGVDQNGYLVGGKMLSEHLSMRLQPTRPGSRAFDPHQFVGRMWVGADLGTDLERYYPKYPIGLPALYTVALWMGGENRGPTLAYWISPLAMTLAVAAMYLLLKQVTTSFWSFCGQLVFATSPVVMSLTTNPNSHATATCFAAWGMYLLLRWWRRGGAWRALLAGFLLGYTCTIRYTEGLLLAPLALVVILNLRWRHARSWLESLWALVGWIIPVGLLVSYNWFSMGRITGYDGTNESIGFSVEYALDNWDSMIRQLGSIALFFVLPFSLIGLAAMLWRSWRVGIVLAAWTVPCVVVYTFYYWAPDPVQQNGAFVSYMRFIVTVLPGCVMTAYWLFDQICRWVATHMLPAEPSSLRIVQASFGLVTLIAVGVQLQSSTFAAELDQNNRLMVQFNTQRVLEAAPAEAVIFAQDSSLLHHLQFVRDYKLYSVETFNKWVIDSLPQMDPAEPQAWEPGRRDALYGRLKDLSQAQLDEEQRKLMIAALDSGRRVFFVIPRRDNDPTPRQRRANIQPIADARRAFAGGDLIRRFAASDRFDFDVIDAWCTPLVRPPSPQLANRPMRRRAETRLDRRSTLWQIVEIVKKAPVPPAPAAVAPAPRPAATRPAATQRRPSPQPATTQAKAPSTRPGMTAPTTRP